MSGRRSKELRSFRCAMEGIAGAVRSEGHVRFHLAATILVAAASAWLKATATDWLWILTAVAAVWVAELFNTALERLVDLASPGQHPLAKAAKDTAAGAVLVAALYAAAVGAIVLGPPLWDKCMG
ncbi:diacylglycerol kinase family protein [Cohnella suwonensis]|uniref:Diacylglycerol kinase family protein n=1 Tax=Cohnella suwonensis TaxID=696072 RepID=A0ABW0LPA2_9BACL